MLLWPLLALAAVLLYNLFFNLQFFHIWIIHGANGSPHLVGSLIDVMTWGSRIMLLSLGMTLVIATGGIDLSVGTVMAIAGCVMASLINPPPDSPLAHIHISGMPALIVSLALLSGLLAGCWNGLLASTFNIQPIVATLILFIAGRGVAQLITGGSKPSYLEYPAIDFIGQGYVFGVPFQVIIVVIATIVTLLLTRATALGLFIESIGNNAPAAEVAGIHARFVKFLCYAFAGLCAAMAGIMQASELRYGDHSNLGLYAELDAIVAVAIGGTSLIGGRFSLIGSLLGAFIMQALRTTILTNSNRPEFNLVIQAAVVLLICLLQADDLRKLLRRLMGRGAPRPGFPVSMESAGSGVGPENGGDKGRGGEK
jgi:simple sugar transport system permease protein